MHIFLALLYLCVGAAPQSSSLFTKGDSVRNTINSIQSIAQTTLVHIDKLMTKLPAPPQIEAATPSVEGLTSIIHYLGVLDDELQSASTQHLSQIQADVSSLNGRVRSLAHTTGCPAQARATAELGNSLFPESRLYLTLAKVQGYLEKLTLNKDKLKVC